MQGIYMIKNKVNGKVYIGQSLDINRRFYTHKNNLMKNKHGNMHLQESWNKYSENNFEFNELEEIIDECKLNEREQSWIEKFNSMDREFGYNLKEAGSIGRFSDEIKNKISLALKNKPSTFKGKKHTLNSKIKMSQSSKGQIPWNKGQHHSSETRLKLSKAWENRVSNRIGAKHTEESRKKMSESTKVTMQSLENRMKCRNHNTFKLSDEQVAEILKRNKNGEEFKKISNDFPLVSRSTIKRVIQGATYKHIDRDSI